MIINIRGSNGAGKSTIVRKIMERHETITQIEYPAEARKLRPMGYLCACDNRRLFIPGHYEIANGGIDTIQDLDLTYKLILEHHGWGANVIYEGMNFTDHVRRIVIMHQYVEVRVMFIDLPLEDCIKSVRARGHKIQEKTIEQLFKKAIKDKAILVNAGVPCFTASREDAFNEIKTWLELK